jgi:hypothetical protein
VIKVEMWYTQTVARVHHRNYGNSCRRLVARREDFRSKIQTNVALSSVLMRAAEKLVWTELHLS